MKRLLQDEMIRGAKTPKTPGQRLELRDAIVPGLMLRISAKGQKSFCLIYKVRGEHKEVTKTGKPKKGKQHRITLGEYPFMTLKAARDEARRLMEAVLDGKDPRATPAPEAMSDTLGHIAERFVAEECAGLASRHRIERTLEMHVLPVLGQRPIRDIDRKAINRLLDEIVRETGKGAAAGVRKHLNGLFEFALDRGEIDGNPMRKLKRKDLKTNGDAGRALDDQELRAIWQAAGQLGYPAGPWIRLLMLTGQRRNEIAEARRSELDVDGRALEIPATRYKTGRAMTVPLVGAAWEIFNDLPNWDEGDFLFSTTHGRVAINSAGAVKKKLDKLAPTDKPWRLHDLRVTCKTRMAALGIKPEHSEAVLGHQKKGMDAVYNKADYLVAKREALTMYADHLLDIVA